MKIKHSQKTTKKLFKDLNLGEVYQSIDGYYYMKIEPYHNANVVDIANGVLGLEHSDKEVDCVDCEILIK